MIHFIFSFQGDQRQEVLKFILSFSYTAWKRCVKMAGEMIEYDIV